MNVENADPERTAAIMEAFVAQVRAFWERNAAGAAPPTNRVILVELFGHGEEIPHVGNLNSLFLARYLQRRSGARIVALVPGRDQPWGREIQSAFGVDEVVDMQRPLEPAEWRASVAGKAVLLGQIDPRAVAASVEGMVLARMPVGDLIYDSYLRQFHYHTVDGLDADLESACTEAAHLNAFYGPLFRRHDVEAVIATHLCYSSCGILLRHALLAGAGAYVCPSPGRWATVKRLRRLEDVHVHECRVDREEGRALSDAARARLTELGAAYIEARFSGARSRATDRTGQMPFFQSFDKHAGVEERRSVLERLGLDPARPTVVILSRCFAENNHLNEWQAYPDWYLCLRDTLSVARGMPEVNWILKRHPVQSYIDQAGGIGNIDLSTTVPVRFDVDGALVAECAMPHIALLPDDVTQATVAGLADAVIAISNGAYEFPARGIPAICPVSGMVEGWDVAVQPRTPEAYRAALAGIASLRVDDERRRRAQFLVGLMHFAIRVEETFLPAIDFMERRNGVALYEEATEMIREARLDDSPFYRAVVRQLATGTPHAMAPDCFEAT